MTSPTDVKVLIFEIDRALASLPEGGVVTVALSRANASLFKDFLYDFDPDMPPRPVCKALGPLVGDIMMNAKLDRLDDLADRLGPLVLLLSAVTRK